MTAPADHSRAGASCVYRSYHVSSGTWSLRVPNRFREFVHLRCRPLIVAIGTAGETACSTLLDQSFGEVGGAGGFACRWKLISIAIQSRKRLCTRSLRFGPDHSGDHLADRA